MFVQNVELVLFLITGHYAARISESAAVTLAACVEFMVSELGDMSLEQLGTRQHKRITPRILTLAVKGDSEFSHLFKHVTISEGGVRPTPGV